MKPKILIKTVFISGFALFFLAGCKAETDMNSMMSGSEGNDSAVYPMYVDDDQNGINDYVEAGSHQTSGSVTLWGNAAEPDDQFTTAETNHIFIDENDNGICDSAEDGSPTWHGPGFVDEDGDGISDYWDEDSPMFNHHNGMYYLDQNHNNINDYVEAETHQSDGHEFVDENSDGICDKAQDGSPTWHGPGYQDHDHNGVHDDWQHGGHGYGHGH